MRLSTIKASEKKKKKKKDNKISDGKQSIMPTSENEPFF
jgi:hypothetical protein